MRRAIVDLKSKRNRGQHPGLLLQRYLAEPVTGDGGNPEERRRLLQEAIGAASSMEREGLYRHAFERWKKSLPPDSKTVELATSGRLAVGFGSENVLEAGITLHHTYGMPIIPGSALKGLASHYCDQVWGTSDDKFKKPSKEEQKAYREYLAGKKGKPPDNYHRLLFGNTDDSGCVIFHDAWYVPGTSPRPLVLDVMTPHHPNFNRAPHDPKFSAPTDLDSPTPIQFLSVTGRFLIALSWRGPETTEAENWLALTLKLLSQALGDWGIGSKTSSGYGRMTPPQHDTPVAPGQQVNRPDYKRGDKITVVRVEDKKGKPRFKADDGFIGHFAGEEPPNIPIGDEIEVYVANVNPQGYTLTMREMKPKQRKRKGKG